ncbi:MAG: ATP phosphoribosyltransferase [Chloroflexi bacterium GWB2_49_20]|nr:MAG: ATP phosphoribosyltransferase [Chloroflexi bacterium GWB2_49_20]OGN77769.1 MAG: ATP phosphoribosyltransferase [Chloroflexi bacterium GWC2_49_37]OGN86544.1 MAG: ATP phosphoribosyltransferase [Chloroflexi bacterium GWD2_49_16]HBG74798.1 ATP phosphoribosyltransferase [Anaerolineae bacterium]
MLSQQTIRLSLPSKGRLESGALDFLSAAGLQVFKTNPRQYQAELPALPELRVIFQRPGDIVVSVRQGSIDFGITGLDMIEEKCGDKDEILILHDALGFGNCALTMAVPETWKTITNIASLKEFSASLETPLRVATKFPVLTKRFLDKNNIPHSLITAEGTLESAPTIGYADMISDLVSTGQTLLDNRLRPLSDGIIQHSQAVLIANRKALQTSPGVLEMARRLLEYIEAHLRAKDNFLVIANMRGENAEVIAKKIFTQTSVGGLQGPTISSVIVRDDGPHWYSATIVVRRDHLPQAISELRLIGGSGIIVSPITYIFEEEPPLYKAMLKILE